MHVAASHSNETFEGPYFCPAGQGACDKPSAALHMPCRRHTTLNMFNGRQERKPLDCKSMQNTSWATNRMAV